MKKTAVILSILLLLSACAKEGAPDREVAASFSPETQIQGGAPEKKPLPAPAAPLSMEETVEAYFARQYYIYISMAYYDISSLIDISQERLANELIWLQTLALRRRLISQNQFCYVERQKYPYTITFQKETGDDRMEFWRSRNIGGEEAVAVNFVITGEKGRAYPPFLAVNNLHTMFLREEEGVWKIVFHHYPGASRFRNRTLTVPGEAGMLASLQEEFSAAPANEAQSIPSGAAPYDGARAAEYAKTYTESANPIFYNAGDWQGNCANFTSQCIWAGFGGEGQNDLAKRGFMTGKWYGGAGGGSPAWENVEHFWQLATGAAGPRSEGIHGAVVGNISQLKPGGMIQTRGLSREEDDEDGFGHSLLLVDPATLLLAQNSPDCLTYYCDLVDSEMRFFNPAYLVE